MQATINSDGTVRYWSVYRQVWVTAMPIDIPDEEYGAMEAEERQAILAIHPAFQETDNA